MPSLNLTPKLSFGPKFRLFITNVYYTESKTLEVLGLPGFYIKLNPAQNIDHLAYPKKLITEIMSFYSCGADVIRVL